MKAALGLRLVVAIAGMGVEGGEAKANKILRGKITLFRGKIYYLRASPPSVAQIYPVTLTLRLYYLSITAGRQELARVTTSRPGPDLAPRLPSGASWASSNPHHESV
jgi:hypothetical protein